MDDDAFEQLVAEGYEQLPSHIREKISNVAVLVEDEPSAEDRELQGLSDDETLLGLYKGTPLTARGDWYGVGMTLPDTITLYRLPIEDEAEDVALEREIPYDEAVKKVVAETIWHEFAHHFGMDEDMVQAREQERDGGAVA